jgi:hypothetical protein
MNELEIESGLPILDDGGRPVNFGWARRGLYTYDPYLLRVSHRRTTARDRYVVCSPTWVFMFEIHDGGYWGGLGVTAVSIRERKIISDFIDIPFPGTAINFTRGSEEGSIRVERKRNRMDFITRANGVRIVRLDIPQFAHRGSLRGELVLSCPPGAQSLVTHSPWAGEKLAFQFSARMPCFIAEGAVQFDNATLVFTRQNAWAMLDWNRAVRPARDLHFLACACGLCGGTQVSVALGHGLADSGWGTENAFFLDGILHKLKGVSLSMPPHEATSPWRFAGSGLDMVFSPIVSDDFSLRALGHSYKTQTFFGFFSGTITLPDGSALDFKNLTGMAENRRTYV